MDRLDRMLNRVETGLAVLAGGLLLFLTFSICASISLRALSLPVPLWSVQFNEYSLLWITFLGAAWLLRRKRHVSLDILSRRLSGNSLRVLHSFEEESKTFREVKSGWNEILSSLKSLLETGRPLSVAGGKRR